MGDLKQLHGNLYYKDIETDPILHKRVFDFCIKDGDNFIEFDKSKSTVDSSTVKEIYNDKLPELTLFEHVTVPNVSWFNRTGDLETLCTKKCYDDQILMANIKEGYADMFVTHNCETYLIRFIDRSVGSRVRDHYMELISRFEQYAKIPIYIVSYKDMAITTTTTVGLTCEIPYGASAESRLNYLIDNGVVMFDNPEEAEFVCKILNNEIEKEFKDKVIDDLTMTLLERIDGCRRAKVISQYTKFLPLHTNASMLSLEAYACKESYYVTSITIEALPSVESDIRVMIHDHVNQLKLIIGFGADHMGEIISKRFVQL